MVTAQDVSAEIHEHMSGFGFCEIWRRWLPTWLRATQCLQPLSSYVIIPYFKCSLANLNNIMTHKEPRDMHMRILERQK